MSSEVGWKFNVACFGPVVRVIAFILPAVVAMLDIDALAALPSVPMKMIKSPTFTNVRAGVGELLSSKLAARVITAIAVNTP